MNKIVELAKKAVETYIKERKIIDIPSTISDDLKEKSGVFVCIKKHGDLRGCIGTFSPTTDNIAEETVRNAIEAATRDPRFPPVSGEELSALEFSVDVLTNPVPAGNIKELDVKRFGIIVKSGGKRGLLLPDLEGVDTVEQQIAICRRKAGIGENDPVEIFKFEVRRYK